MNPTEALKNWTIRFRDVDMPIFGAIALELSRLTTQKTAPTSTLANVILQDPSMTSRVLRVANSAFYTKISQITTISKAITLLGFDVVGKLCLSAALVDSLLKGRPKRALLRELARSFYSAILARTMAERRRDESSEEVFIAALLYRLGPMAFLCHGGASADRFELLLEEESVDPRKAEMTLLGFHLDDLTLELAKAWNLGGLLITAHSIKEQEGGRTCPIVLAHEFTKIVSDRNRKDERREYLMAMARHCQVPAESMEELVRATAELAVDFARKIGADAAIPEIPGLKGLTLLETDSGTSFPVPGDVDSQLQLKILRELVMGASSEMDPETAIQLALEGLYRGVGLDRVIYLRIADSKLTMKAQFALGPDHDRILSDFEISLENRNVLAESCKDDQSIWAPILPESEKVLFSESVQQILKMGPFLFSPVRNKSGLIGAIYADRLPSGRLLDRECSEGFELFCFQLKWVLAQGR